MKWDEDLPRTYEQPKSMPAIVAGVLFVLFAGLFIFFMYRGPHIEIVNSAHAAESAQCDYPESLILDALKDSPDRLIKKLEGKELSAFLSKMSAKGYLTGTIDQVDTLYIISGKLLPGATEPIDILFFVQNGCILGKIYGTAKIVEELL